MSFKSDILIFDDAIANAASKYHAAAKRMESAIGLVQTQLQEAGFKQSAIDEVTGIMKGTYHLEDWAGAANDVANKAINTFKNVCRYAGARGLEDNVQSFDVRRLNRHAFLGTLPGADGKISSFLNREAGQSANFSGFMPQMSKMEYMVHGVNTLGAALLIADGLRKLSRDSYKRDAETGESHMQVGTIMLSGLQLMLGAGLAALTYSSVKPQMAAIR